MTGKPPVCNPQAGFFVFPSQSLIHGLSFAWGFPSSWETLQQLLNVVNLVTVPGLKPQSPNRLQHQELSLTLLGQGRAQMATAQFGRPALKASERKGAGQWICSNWEPSLAAEPGAKQLMPDRY
jgi:hypothetical protein